MSDVVYILKNPAFPGLIKIGQTKNLAQRLRSLSSQSGVPQRFKCYYACRVKDGREVERRLHKAFRDKRVEGNREFFEIDADQVKAVLEFAALKEVTLSSDARESEPIPERSSSRRSPFRFSMVGIQAGAELSYVRNPRVKCTVHDDRKVRFEGQVMTLTQAATIALRRDNVNWSSVGGPHHWMYANEVLSERRARLEESDMEATRLVIAKKAAPQPKSRSERRAPFRFSMVGIREGMELNYVRDPRVTCTVHDDRMVRFEGQVMTLSRAADTVLRRDGVTWSSVAGPHIWTYNGETLNQMRLRMEQTNP